MTQGENLYYVQDLSEFPIFGQLIECTGREI